MADEREQALHYAARLRGLTLVRSGEKYALVHYVLDDASRDSAATEAALAEIRRRISEIQGEMERKDSA